MRILNVSAQKPDSTGSGIYLSQLVRCQLEAGHQVAVVCGIDAGDSLAALDGRAQVFPVCFKTSELPFHVCGMSDVMPYKATRYRDLTPEMAAAYEQAFAEAVRAAATTFKPDVVVVHHLYLLMALVCELLPDLPVVAISHATDLRQYEQHGLARERIKAAAAQLDGIFALHGAHAAHIQELFALEAGRVHVLGTGYDATRFLPGASAREPKSILFVGKVCEAKGVLSLMRALHLLEQTPGATLPSVVRLAGGWGNCAHEQERVSKEAAKLAVPIEFLGRKPQEDLVKLYQTSEVFVLPSFFEGLPLVLVEALACGCKAVSTELSGVRLWIEAHAPDAPIWWVSPPTIHDVDKPAPEELPAFEARLAAALEAALAAPAAPVDMTSLAWQGVWSRLEGWLFNIRHITEA